MTNHLQTDIVIIGAGPVGLFAIFEAGMLKMQCHVIDNLDFVGGQCTALYPEKPIYDIPAHPQITAEDLISNLKQQADVFNPVYHLGQTAVKIRQLDAGEVQIIAENNPEKIPAKFLVTTSTNINIATRAIVIAAGCGAFGPNRPPLENIELYENKSIFYMVGKKDNFKDKNVVIAGGGDSAVDWAIILADIAKKLYVVHRRPKFKCAPESESKLKALADSRKIELVIPYQLDSLKGSNCILDTVIVKDLDGNTKNLEADILLPFFGLAMELGPILDWGLNINKSHITVEPSTMETSISGIYAIGDIVSYPNKLKLILNGFAEAATACHAARSLVYKGAEHHFEYSTTKGIPITA